MIDGIYNGAASLSALERWQGVISENLASSNAAGFKKQELTFEGVRSNQTAVERENGFPLHAPGTMPRPGVANDFSAGDLRQTDKPTDFAISGPGFFQIQRGTDTAYTRDGEFHINADNVLVTKHGEQVLGEGGPIAINPEDGPVTLGEDGTLSQGDNVVGKITLRDFADTDSLQRLDSGLFTAPRGAGSVLENPSISQGAIETSNVSPMSEMVNLIAVSRAYEATQKMITSQDENMRQAIQTLGGTLQA